ncbi:glycosyltransferase [Rothia sp. AR01]|uniref:Glycosyltransferase n=1 Tax=Rothia santali TaxID=2949643 RepID=A0A9X2HAQ3_9MICC|nr:glycosyltransferase family 2 protein [Rothia santali]MCP3424670.1 glycosyltransferase [Rothia santali]
MSKGRHRRQPPPKVGPLAFSLAVVYGVAASFIFCFSGTFGTYGQHPWHDTLLVLVTITAAVALTYITLLLRVYTLRPATRGGNPDVFSWHLMIPCRDEESVIAATVSAARTSFPHCHVWVIDDDSEDATARIVRDLMDFDDRIHLISRVRPNARTGKGDALNAAFKRVAEYVGPDPEARRRAVVGVLDADGYLSDNTLELLSGPDAFGNGGIGAVQIEVWMKNRNDRRPRPQAGAYLNALGRYLIRMQDMEFRTSNSAMQLLRVQTGTVGMGGNGQFTRLSVLEDLTAAHSEPWGKSLSEDYELGLNIISLGHTNHYVREAYVSQEALPYFKRLITQRTRWAQGIMQCSALLPSLRRSRSLKASGFAEIHYFMTLPWIMIMNLAFVPWLLYVALTSGQAGFLGGDSTLVVAAAGMVFLVLPYALWGPLYRHWGRERRVGWATSWLLGAGYLLYVYFTYLYYPRAIGRMITKRTSWAKTARNADGLQTAVAPELVPALAVGNLLALDTRVLAELAEDLESETYAREVVAAFVLRWPARLANLRETVAAESPVRARDAVASIRVSSTMVGARQLEGAAREVTDLLQAEDYDAARSLMPALEGVGERTVAAIRAEYLGE